MLRKPSYSVVQKVSSRSPGLKCSYGKNFTSVVEAWFSYAADIPETDGLGHCYGICEHLSPNHNQFQALTASLPAKLSWVQLRRRADGCRRWKYFIWTSSAAATYSSKTIRSIFTGEMVENYAVRFAFRANLSTSAIHRKCAGNSLSPLGHRLGRRDMRTRLSPSIRSHR